MNGRMNSAKRAGIGIVLILSAITTQAAGYYNSFFGFKNRTPKLAFTTSAQNLYASLCSSIVTVQTKNSFGVPTNVTSDLTVNLSIPAGVTLYSDSNCTQPVANVIITTGTNSKSFYFLSTAPGATLITATATGYIETSQTETLTINPYIWTGGGADTDWNTAANWSGGSAPGSGNIAVFDGTCVSNCSPTTSANINVSGVRMHSGYAGTITQGMGFTITLGAKGWAQLAGSFAGGNSAITSGGPISLAAGSFTSTSGTFTVSGNWTISNNPGFNANSGTLSFNSDNTITPGSVHYNHVGFIDNFYYVHSLNSGTMLIDGNLTLACNATSACSINSGTLQVYGDVTASNYGARGNATIRLAGSAAGQTLTGGVSAMLPALDIAAGANNVTLSGSIYLEGPYSVTSVGTLTTTGSTLTLNGGGTILPGTAHYNNVTFSGYTATFDLGGSTMHVDGVLKIASNSISPVSNINSGTLVAHGDVVASSFGAEGNVTIQLAGNVAGQTITGISSANFPNLVIDTGVNNVTFSGTFSLRGNYTLTSVGNLVTTGSTLILSGGGTVTPGAVHYNNVTFASYASNYQLGGGTMHIDGTLNFASTSSSPPGGVNSGTLMVYGSVTTTNFGATGDAQIQFAGNTSQTITVGGSASLPTGNVTVNIIGGGTLNLGSNVSWNNTGQTLTVNSGGINMTANNLTVKSLSLNGNTITKGGGTLTVNGAVAGTGGLYGGTVDP